MKITLVSSLRLVLLLLVQFSVSNVSASEAVQSGSAFVVKTVDDLDRGQCGVDTCTLREAINAVNSTAEISTITFDANVFGTAQSILPASALPAITKTVTIIGPGANLLKVQASGTPNFDIFRVSSTATATFSGLTISNGYIGIDNDGKVTTIGCTLSGNVNSGIYSDGSDSVTTATNCTFSNNQSGIYNNGLGTVAATDCIFGSNSDGLYNSGGTATATNCTFSGNTKHSLCNTGTATAINCIFGGNTAGLYNYDGTATLTRCVFNGNANSALYNDNGVMRAAECTLNSNNFGVFNTGTLTTTACTLSSNRIGIENTGTASTTDCTIGANIIGINNDDGTLTSTNCTVSANSTYGIRNKFGAVALMNTLCVGNATNTNGTITNSGHNILSGTVVAAGLEVDSNGAPLLKDNGGPTFTIALLTGTAVDAGDNSLIPVGTTTDQRGQKRLQGGVVDIGAFETVDTSQDGPSFVVNKTADTDDGNCGAVDCTLREAINAANSNSDFNAITFAATPFSTTQSIALDRALPTMTGAVNITGPGANLLTVTGGGTAGYDIFTVESDVTAALSGFTLSNSNRGINNEGTLSVTNCTLSSNAIGIENTGTITAAGCTLNANVTGLNNDGSGMVTATNCTLSGNTNCGVRNNQDGIINATNCTLGGNDTGIFSGGGSVRIKNTLCVGSTTTNIDGDIIDDGHNITVGTVEQAGLDPAGLQYNGGPTKTIALLTGSPAIDSGDDAAAPATDQRGVTRPQGVHTDIGAFEILTLTVNDVTVTEGDSGTANAIFTVSLSAASARMVTVDYATSDGATSPAIVGTDYTATTGTLTFAPGETTKTITVPVIGDTLDESNETFFVNLSNATNILLADAQGLGTIIDDDGTPTLSVNDATVTEGDPAQGAPGTVNATFTVSLSNASAQTVTVDYSTADGTTNAATVDTDYTSAVGTLTFAPGEITKTITVPVIGDTLDEPNETFFINLSNISSSATLADSQGLGTITDDDAPPTMVINDVTVTEGNNGWVDATFTVSLSAASAQTVTVDYVTADGTTNPATADTDYTALSLATLTFAPGEISKAITVPVIGDTLNESNETFFVNLSNAANTLITDAQGLGTITDDDAPPTMAINDVTVTEGNPDKEAPGTVNATFTVSLSAVSGQIVTVDYITADGTANPAAVGTDYTATTGTLTFAPGETTKTITVPVISDLLDELDETFIVNLSNPANALITDAQGLGSIIDDDDPPSMSISDVTVTEGDSGTVNANFTVTLSSASGRTVTVDYASSDSTTNPATVGTDYTATAGTLTFAPGETTKTIAVPIIGDLLDELDETFFANLSNTTNALVTDAQGLGTITDDDATPSLAINDVTVTEGNPAEGAPATAEFKVSLSAASGQTVTVDYATADGTTNPATAGADYTALPLATLTFAPGETTKTITVPVIGDLLDESNETFFVNLSNNSSSATLADGQGLGTITDDDAPPSMILSDVTVTEGDSAEGAPGTVNAIFTVSLSTVSGQTVTVDYATADGITNPATARADYTTTAGTLTFAPGETTKTITVPVIGDLLDELDETFFVNLSNAPNVLLADAQGLGTITDDDATPSLAIDDVTVTEGNPAQGAPGTVNATFTVSLSAPSGQIVTVDYATADGTTNPATVGTDYTATTGILTFAPGETTKTITVPVISDLLDELDETFIVNLSNAPNALITDAQGLGTITDDDDPPTMTINDVTVTEGDSGTVNANFTVTLSSASGRTVTADYASAGSTTNPATVGTDYTATAGTLTFAPGETTKTIAVPIIGDLLDELDETFFANLSNTTNALVTDAQGLGTITDDDATPSLAINDVTVTEGNPAEGAPATAEFKVSLSAASGQTVTVDYATADGTTNPATAGADYTALPLATLTFAPGETTKTITVPVIGDLLDESNETFFVNLSNPANAVLADAQGLSSITDDDDQPSMSINDVTVTEGNPAQGAPGTVNATFVVSLSAVSGQTLTVDYATAGGTTNPATAGADYTSTVGTLTFAPGEITKTITVPVTSDLLDEPNETFCVNLSNATNALVGDAQGLGTITDDDAPPSLFINDVTVTEGNSGWVDATFTVRLSTASGQTVTVDYGTADGTTNPATLGIDYASAIGTLTFAPGETAKTIAVPVIGDLLDELNETFFVNLSNPTNALLADAQGLGTITDDDATPSLAINDVTVTEGNSGIVNATFTVTLSAPSGRTVTVKYQTTAPSSVAATADVDYVAVPLTVLSFAPGETIKPITVQVKGDTLDEVDERFVVKLSAATNATIADSEAFGTIADDDAAPALSISDVTVTEGNSDITNAVFNVSLNNPSGQTVTVKYATAGVGSAPATAGVDYVAVPQTTLTFAAGETIKQVTVQVKGDLSDEVDEGFAVNLSAATNATVADSQGLGTITDDDAPPDIVIDDVSVTEGDSGIVNTAMHVRLSVASGKSVTVKYATAASSSVAATADVDYVAVPLTTLTFAPGETTKPITMQVKGDTLDEADERFVVKLSAAANATITDREGFCTITNDDAAPSLSINDVTITEGPAQGAPGGTTPAIFTVTLSAVSGKPVTVQYNTATPGSIAAMAGSDYVAVPLTTLTFAPGETTKQVTVLVNGDVLDEDTERFIVNLQSAGNATIADREGFGTITDDDDAPSLRIDDVSLAEGNSGTTAFNFTVSLSAASGKTVSVKYQTANPGSLIATAGTDYVAVPLTTLTFAPGETNKTVTVLVNGDTIIEGTERFIVKLSSQVNSTIADAEGFGTITNDDVAGVLFEGDTTNP